MADKKTTQFTVNTTPAVGDYLPMIDDPAGVPANNIITFQNFFKTVNVLTDDAGISAIADYIPYYRTSASETRKVEPIFMLALGLPNGRMLNGKLSVSASAGVLTVSVLTEAGGTPSATDPVFVKIAGTVRKVTSALTITAAAATNWCNSGSAELATLEVDYFTYLSWHTASSAVRLGFARIPYASVYSDFSATSTAETFGKFDTNPASTDDVEVIGRFSAILSAGAGFTWTVPTFSSKNLKQYPIWNTRYLDWNPTFTGFSANPTGLVHKYQMRDNRINLDVRQLTNGTSNATTFTMTAPFTVLTLTNGAWDFPVNVVDNGVVKATPGLLRATSASNVLNVFTDFSGAAWTNINGKRLGVGSLSYPITTL